MHETLSFRPTFKRGLRITRIPASIESSFRIRQLQGRILLMISYNILTLRGCVRLTSVVFELSSVPISRASFKFSNLFPVTILVLLNCLEVQFVDVLEQCLVTSQTPFANPAFMNVDKLWPARAPDYINENLV